jgi:hypothetical protein
MRDGVDVVITIGCGDFCPILPRRPYEECVLSIPSATHHPGRIACVRAGASTAGDFLDGAGYFVVSVEHLAVAIHVHDIDAHHAAGGQADA